MGTGHTWAWDVENSARGKWFLTRRRVGGYKERKKCGFVLCKHSFCTIREEEVGSNPGKEHTIAIVRPYTALQWVKGKENSSYKKPAGL